MKNEGYLESEFKLSVPEGQWMTLIEYASESGVSLSTLRRSIKNGRLRFKQEDGKYWIWGAPEKAAASGRSKSTPVPNHEFSSQIADWAMEVEALKLEVRHLQEEIAELKTWVAFSDRETRKGLA